jgi:RNA polymerase sigma factor (sigma-70 family)
MSEARLQTLIQYLRRKACAGDPCASDGELLRRFARERDAAAFELLVRRHGPMVLGVCRRLVGVEQDVEDAFQATFLALVRRAASVSRGEAIGAWLHKVAYRVALAVRAQRRDRREQPMGERVPFAPSSDPHAEAVWRELRSVVDEEVSHLPRPYREAFVLCSLSGKTNTEAAQELGCPVGTVESRLVRARARLRAALLRRGFAPSLVALAVPLAPEAVGPAIPVTATVQAALLLAAGNSVSPTAALADGVLLAMSTTKLNKALVIVGLGLLVATAGMHAMPAREHKAAPPPAAAESPPAPDRAPEKGALTRSGRTDLFGDPLPPDALARMGTVRHAQGDSLDGPPVLAPDHRLFATVSTRTPHGPGRVICLWDAATGRELRSISDPDVEYFKVFFLKSAPLLGAIGSPRHPRSTTGPDYVIHYWDPATGQKAPAARQGASYPFEAWAWVLSADEQWVASAGQQPPVVVRERKTGKELARWKGKADRIDHLAFSPDGKTLALCGENGIRLWDWQGKAPDRSLGDFPKHVQGLWFSPDGRWFAAAIYKEGLRVWKTRGLTEARRFPGESDIRFLPDGKSLVSTTTGVVWDVSSGERRGRFENCQHCLTLEFSADGRTATGYALGRIRQWETATGKDQSPPAPIERRIMIHQVGFLPGGKEVVAASPDGSVRVWEAATGKELRTLVKGTEWDQHPTFLRVGGDGTVAVARGNRLSFFRGEEKPQQVTLTDFPEDVVSLNLSPDGKTLVLAGGANPGRLVLWDLPSRKIVARWTPPEGASLECLAVFSSRQIAAHVVEAVSLLNGGEVGRTLAARPERPQPKPGTRRTPRGGYSYFPGIQALGFSPEGDTLLSAGHPAGGLTLLDVFSGRTRHVLLPADDSDHYDLRNAVFSPDGRMVAAESEAGVVDIWESSSGQRRRRFLGHRSYQTTLAFSPDGGRLATGNRDATILIWDVFGVATQGPAEAPPGEAEIAALWARLRDADAERACRAMGWLMRFPGVTIPFLKARLLEDKSPQAARLRNWVADLDSEEFEKRQTASRELSKCLTSAEPLLKERLANSPSLEVQRRIEKLLLRADHKPLAAETLRSLRALEILEHLGFEGAGDVVRQLAEGPYDPQVATAARSARKRMTAKELR